MYTVHVEDVGIVARTDSLTLAQAHFTGQVKLSLLQDEPVDVDLFEDRKVIQTFNSTTRESLVL